MSKMKDMMLFGNEKEVCVNNRIIGAGITMLLVGLITTVIGEYRSGKSLMAITGKDEIAKATINNMYDEIDNIIKSK